MAQTIQDGTVKWSLLQIQDKQQLNSMTFTGSTQGKRTAIVTNIDGTIDDSSNTGSGNITQTTYTFVTNTGIKAGTYSIQAILQSLIQLSHSHRTTKGVSSWNCNCKCDCTCD